MNTASGLLIWWVILCTVTILNISAWGYSAVILNRRKTIMPPAIYETRKWLLWLSAVYVLGCGFRSILPMVDVPRICLVDTWFSRIAVGRSVATVAELCLIIQWALLMREAGKDVGVYLATLLSRILVPIIVVAEMFSWYAVLTTNYVAHVVENSLWTLSAIVLVAGFVALWPRVSGNRKHFLTAAIGCGMAYIAFMIAVDVPMYVSRWRADVALERQYLSLSAGILEVMQRCIVTQRWEAWLEDIPWMTLYFSVAVWFSIALTHAPAFNAGHNTASSERQRKTQSAVG